MALKKLQFFKLHPDGFGTTKDLTNGLMSNAITLIKDTMPAPDAPSITGDLKGKVMEMIRTWRDSTASLQGAFFRGDANSISQLAFFLKDGKLLVNGYQGLTYPQIQDQMEKTLNTILTPIAWAFAPDHAPFILDSKAACSKTAEKGVSDNGFPTGLQKISASCYNDLWYDLASASGPERTCQTIGTGNVKTCELKKISVPPGLDKLDGNLWAGITIRNLTVAAVNTYTNNGRKYGAGIANPVTSSSSLDSLQTFGLLTPGIVTIPVCLAAEAKVNWKTYTELKKNSANYPCS